MITRDLLQYAILLLGVFYLCGESMLEDHQLTTLSLQQINQSLPKAKDAAPCTRNFKCEDAFIQKSCDVASVMVASSTRGKHFLENSVERISFWGDSVSAEAECDLRSWALEYNLLINSTDYSGFIGHRGGTVRYLEVGRPWFPTLDTERLTREIALATVVVFNIGAHYENGFFSLFVEHLRTFEIIFRNFTTNGGLLFIRSPSPTHFATKGGLYENASGPISSCVPRNGFDMPDNIAEQDRLLRELAMRVDATYLDIYYLSDKYDQHVGRTSQNTTDCRHFCQRCPILRTWNSLLIHEILRHRSS